MKLTQQELFKASRFLATVAQRHPQWLASGQAERPRARGEVAAQLGAALADAQDEAAVMRLLRQFRERELARIAWRDLATLAPLDETLGDLSELAEVCCRLSVDYVLERLVERYGQPRDAQGEPVRPFVLGMGKLGGRELNFSSDIDLIFCHTAGGETDGARALNNAEFFKRLVQGVTRLLAERTEHGHVFRVDTLLRPFGSSGPVSIALDAAEDYYQVHGREWERYALIKARPVAGDLKAGWDLLARLRPFVYRRYLDFNAIESLRALKKLIADDVARRGRADNVKLGRGGIRELEFIVQSFQLVRGGQEPRLRDTRLRPVLRYLGEAGHLPAETAARLDSHYVFLRRLENAIQMYADAQTHELPENEEEREALRVALGFVDWASLARRFESVRGEVHEEFMRLFAERREHSRDQGLTAVVDALWETQCDVAALTPPLAQAGFGERAGALAKTLRDLRLSRALRQLSETAQERLRQLLPLLLEQALEQEDAVTAAIRVLGVIQAIGGRTTYVSLLRESAPARGHLVKLCAASPWISQLLAATPALLDALLDPRSLYSPPGKQEIREELDAIFADIPINETELGMDALRRYRWETTLRIAAADVAGSLPLVQVSDRLTWLAEAVLSTAFDRAYAELRESFGVPLRRDGQPAGLAAIAYGKFGGIEMGYSSDLDLVFIHDCDAPEQETQGGARTVAGGVFMTRWAQRIIHWLSTLTPAGRAYEVDLELRPSGRSGLSVVSMAGFDEYQRHRAWTWEHQALTRARFVGGSREIGERFDAVRREVLCQARDAAKLRQDIAEMRAKMRDKLERREPDRWDVKQGEGGLIDIEFITQYLVLREAHRDPTLVAWSDNWRQLEALCRAGMVTPAQRDVLIDSYRALRAWSHSRGLQQQDGMAPLTAFARERDAVRACWYSIGPGIGQGA